MVATAGAATVTPSAQVFERQGSNTGYNGSFNAFRCNEPVSQGNRGFETAHCSAVSSMASSGTRQSGHPRMLQPGEALPLPVPVERVPSESRDKSTAMRTVSHPLVSKRNMDEPFWSTREAQWQGGSSPAEVSRVRPPGAPGPERAWQSRSSQRCISPGEATAPAAHHFSCGETSTVNPSHPSFFMGQGLHHFRNPSGLNALDNSYEYPVSQRCKPNFLQNTVCIDSTRNPSNHSSTCHGSNSRAVWEARSSRTPAMLGQQANLSRPSLNTSSATHHCGQRIYFNGFESDLSSTEQFRLPSVGAGKGRPEMVREAIASADLSRGPTVNLDPCPGSDTCYLGSSSGSSWSDLAGKPQYTRIGEKSGDISAHYYPAVSSNRYAAKTYRFECNRKNLENRALEGSRGVEAVRSSRSSGYQAITSKQQRVVGATKGFGGDTKGSEEGTSSRLPLIKDYTTSSCDGDDSAHVEQKSSQQQQLALLATIGAWALQLKPFIHRAVTAKSDSLSVGGVPTVLSQLPVLLSNISPECLNDFVAATDSTMSMASSGNDNSLRMPPTTTSSTLLARQGSTITGFSGNTETNNDKSEDFEKLGNDQRGEDAALTESDPALSILRHSDNPECVPRRSATAVPEDLKELPTRFVKNGSQCSPGADIDGVNHELCHVIEINNRSKASVTSSGSPASQNQFPQQGSNHRNRLLDQYGGNSCRGYPSILMGFSTAEGSAVDCGRGAGVVASDLENLSKPTSARMGTASRISSTKAIPGHVLSTTTDTLSSTSSVSVPSGRSQFVRTKMCPYQSRGSCSNRSTCSYAHSEEELRPLPDLRQTKLCEATKKGVECCDPTCSYAHTVTELKPSPDLASYKTTLCFFWRKSKCFNGSKCRFAHGVHELRPKEPTLNVAATGVGGAGNQALGNPLPVTSYSNLQPSEQLPAFPVDASAEAPVEKNGYANQQRSEVTFAPRYSGPLRSNPREVLASRRLQRQSNGSTMEKPFEQRVTCPLGQVFDSSLEQSWPQISNHNANQDQQSVSGYPLENMSPTSPALSSDRMADVKFDSQASAAVRFNTSLMLRNSPSKNSLMHRNSCCKPGNQDPKSEGDSYLLSAGCQGQYNDHIYHLPESNLEELLHRCQRSNIREDVPLGECARGTGEPWIRVGSARTQLDSSESSNHFASSENSVDNNYRSGDLESAGGVMGTSGNSRSALEGGTSGNVGFCDGEARQNSLRSPEAVSVCKEGGLNNVLNEEQLLLIPSEPERNFDNNRGGCTGLRTTAKKHDDFYAVRRSHRSRTDAPSELGMSPKYPDQWEKTYMSKPSGMIVKPILDDAAYEIVATRGNRASFATKFERESIKKANCNLQDGNNFIQNGATRESMKVHSLSHSNTLTVSPMVEATSLKPSQDVRGSSVEIAAGTGTKERALRQNSRLASSLASSIRFEAKGEPTSEATPTSEVALMRLGNGGFKDTEQQGSATAHSSPRCSDSALSISSSLSEALEGNSRLNRVTREQLANQCAGGLEFFPSPSNSSVLDSDSNNSNSDQGWDTSLSKSGGSSVMNSQCDSERPPQELSPLGTRSSQPKINSSPRCLTHWIENGTRKKFEADVLDSRDPSAGQSELLRTLLFDLDNDKASQATKKQNSNCAGIVTVAPSDMVSVTVPFTSSSIVSQPLVSTTDPPTINNASEPHSSPIEPHASPIEPHSFSDSAKAPSVGIGSQKGGRTLLPFRNNSPSSTTAISSTEGVPLSAAGQIFSSMPTCDASLSRLSTTDRSNHISEGITHLETTGSFQAAGDPYETTISSVPPTISRPNLAQYSSLNQVQSSLDGRQVWDRSSDSKPRDTELLSTNGEDSSGPNLLSLLLRNVWATTPPLQRGDTSSPFYEPPTHTPVSGFSWVLGSPLTPPPRATEQANSQRLDSWGSSKADGSIVKNEMKIIAAAEKLTPPTRRADSFTVVHP